MFVRASTHPFFMPNHEWLRVAATWLLRAATIEFKDGTRHLTPGYPTACEKRASSCRCISQQRANSVPTACLTSPPLPARAVDHSISGGVALLLPPFPSDRCVVVLFWCRQWAVDARRVLRDIRPLGSRQRHPPRRLCQVGRVDVQPRPRGRHHAPGLPARRSMPVCCPCPQCLTDTMAV